MKIRSVFLFGRLGSPGTIREVPGGSLDTFSPERKYHAPYALLLRWKTDSAFEQKHHTVPAGAEVELGWRRGHDPALRGAEDHMRVRRGTQEGGWPMAIPTGCGRGTGGRVAERSEFSNPMIASGNHPDSNNGRPYGEGGSLGVRALSVFYYLLSIVHYPLPIDHCPLFIAHCPLSIIHYPLSIKKGVLFQHAFWLFTLRERRSGG